MSGLNWEKANRWAKFRKEAQSWNWQNERKNKKLLEKLISAREIVGEISKKKFWGNKRYDLQTRKKCNHENYKRFFPKDAKIVCKFCGQKI